MPRTSKPFESNNQLERLLLAKRLSDGQLIKQPLAGIHKISVEAGARYALLDPLSGKPPTGFVLKSKGKDLLVEWGGQRLEIENFFAAEGAEFHPTGTLEPDAPAGIVIQAQSDAHVAQDDAERLVWSPATTELAPLPQLIGGGLLGLGALAGGGGGGESASPEEPKPQPPASSGNTVKGTVVGGPVIAGNGLTVAVFAADGVSKLGEAKVDANGSFTVSVGSYTGVVIARVIDADAGVDYLDEATGAAKDLNAELLSIEVMRAGSNTVTANLNMLSTLAYHKAVEQSGSVAISPSIVDNANKAVATLFGLESLHGISVMPTNSGGFSSLDGLSPGEVYGLVLAAFSGADAARGGDSQQTLNAVLTGLKLNGAVASLTPAAQADLIVGVKAALNGAGAELLDKLSTLVDTTPPQFQAGQLSLEVNENTAGGTSLHRPKASDPSGVRYSLKPVGDHAAFSIDASSGTLSLIARPDFETQSSYTVTIIATDTAGNTSEQVIKLGVNNLDELAPTITSASIAAAIAENSGAGQVVYTATSTDAGDIATGSTVYSLKTGLDAALFSINASSGAVTLTGNPDYESKSGYSFTVVATDAAGNASEQTVTLAIGNRDEVAPTITSGATSSAINENSGAGQVVYTATSTDAGDIATGSTIYSLKTGLDAALFSINASTGAVTLTGNPDYESKSGYSFTVVATDAAGNASEQTVNLAINDLTDETAPTISSLALSASGAQNSTLNAGDVLSVTVNLDEATVVNTAGGTPRIALNLGGSTVYAHYVSGSGSTALLFQYTVQAGDTDANGISLAANSLNTNGGTLRDASGNALVLSHGALSDNASYKVDASNPAFSSGGTATAINENSGAGQVVYTAAASDAGSLSYSLKTGLDAALFSINASTGAVTLTGNPDYESKSSYSFTVVATDAAGNASEQTVTLAIGNRDEVAPTITSGATASAINENSGAGQVVYTATSTDAGDIATGSTAYSLKTGLDAALFSINASTGAVTLTGNPDYESKNSYSFTVVAIDAAGNASEQTVTLAIGNRDEIAPTFTSGATATAINENSGAGQVVYTATSTDAGDIATGSTIYSLKTGLDAAQFSINASTGAVTLTGNPDYESKSSYSFTVVATDAAGNASEQTVTLAIGNRDEVAPTLTSGATASAINENSGAGQVVYTATSTDAGDIATGSTVYSLKTGLDAALFSINASTGAVTLTGNPDYESKSSYSFTVVATDAAGNASEQTVNLAINDLPLAVSGVSSSTAAGSYKVGDVISIQIAFSEAVIVTGTPQLTLETGSVDRVVNYTSGSGTDTLTFSYTVQAGDTATDLDYLSTSALSLNGGSIRDAAGNAAVLTLATPGGAGSLGANESLLIDGIVPTVTGVSSSTAAGSYKVGDVISIQVAFSETVNVTGTPQLTLETGGVDRVINYASGSGSNTLSFNYTVQAGDTSADLDYLSTSALSLNGGSIRDTAGNNATLTLASPGAAGSLGANESLLIDGIVPTVTSVSSSTAAGSYQVGQTISIQVNFSEAVTVTGTPQLTLETGSVDRVINYLSGSGSNTLTFTYTVQPGDGSADLDYKNSSALALNDGTIRDLAGNNATLTLPTPGAAGSLGSNEAIIVRNTSVVVFDLVGGVSSDHSNRTFDASTSYTIYIRVNSNSGESSWDGTKMWNGGNNLGLDDKIVLVGSGAPVKGGQGGNVHQTLNSSVPQWLTLAGSVAAVLFSDGQFVRRYANSGSNFDQLWNGHWMANPNNGSMFGNVYKTNMPAGVLTSQGLA